MALRILGYGCTTAAGPTTEDYWQGLIQSVDHSQTFQIPQTDFSLRLCQWKGERASSSLNQLAEQLILAWNQIPEKTRSNLNDLGVIFASTKGCTQDWVTENKEASSDPLTPVLVNFLERTKLSPKEFICISNACSSTIGALFLSEKWMEQKRVKSVLILAADEASSFVSKGFFALRALTQKRARPFSADRDGLQLGEGAAALLVSRDSQGEEGIVINSIGIDTEGFAIARPSHSGESLFRAAKKALGANTPDLIVAHGTGTVANDEVEDHVFHRLFENKKIPVTSTKWSVGHTLGVSGAIDLIAACEILKKQMTFKIANTFLIDPKFKNTYLHRDQELTPFKIRSIMVSSLGFGGVHGSFLLSRALHDQV
jgi:3-oxoacyl-[acyl-carrier-protein] synthase-1